MQKLSEIMYSNIFPMKSLSILCKKVTYCIVIDISLIHFPGRGCLPESRRFEYHWIQQLLSDSLDLSLIDYSVWDAVCSFGVTLYVECSYVYIKDIRLQCGLLVSALILLAERQEGPLACRKPWSISSHRLFFHVPDLTWSNFWRKQAD